MVGNGSSPPLVPFPASCPLPSALSWVSSVTWWWWWLGDHNNNTLAAMASFNEDGLKKKLDDLNMSQQSIQTVSLWLIHHKKHAHTVVNVWYRELIGGESELVARSFPGTQDELYSCLFINFPQVSLYIWSKGWGDAWCVGCIGPASGRNGDVCSGITCGCVKRWWRMLKNVKLKLNISTSCVYIDRNGIVLQSIFVLLNGGVSFPSPKGIHLTAKDMYVLCKAPSLHTSRWWIVFHSVITRSWDIYFGQ